MNRALVIPTSLSLIAGVTDVTSWLLLGGFFSAHVTGNVVVVAADLVTGAPPDVVAMLAIPVFILTTALATVVARRIGSQSPHVTSVLFGAQAAFLVAAGALSFTTHASAHPRSAMAIVIGICAVCAMATQNAYLHIVPPRALSTAVMTGNLVAATVAATDILRTRGHAPGAAARWTASWPLLAGFVGGCLIGAAGATLFSDQAALIPALLAVTLLAIHQITKGIDMTNDPNWKLPSVPAFTLSSPDFSNGGELPRWARGSAGGGEDRSPELHWEGAPAGTQSYVLTVFDPDAPSGSGFWHWTLIDIPAGIASLPRGAGTDDALLPAGAARRRNEYGTDVFIGAAPPAGTGPHRYTYTLSALDIPALEVAVDATPAIIGLRLRPHIIGRAQLIGLAQTGVDGAPEEVGEAAAVSARASS
ncbi:YbhB/YbcL family Raf kinase inhibitor-like protein [Herbiconiux sp. UC225_62]|uniref:YbhB/YbcL family Raf kinase inhibitor-like protein n=1 Tax=Herbiconiux sp. UC225_62 TaxID=3350168 RepID=UPI0036D2BACF